MTWQVYAAIAAVAGFPFVCMVGLWLGTLVLRALGCGEDER